MQFQKKTSAGKSKKVIRLLINFLFLFVGIFLLLVLIDKINFPYPNKKIEKIITNESFKVIK